jgi:hypothetical protein
MSTYSWDQTLITAQVDGTALASSSSATSILPAAAKFTLPANFLAIGSSFRVKATGRVSTLVTSPGTLTLDLRLGAVIAWNGGAMTLNTTAQTNATWTFEAFLTVRAIGASTSANLIGCAEWKSRAIVGSAAAGSGGTPSLILPDTAPAVGTGFDSTATQVIDMFATWSVNNAANSILLHQFSVEAMN